MMTEPILRKRFLLIGPVFGIINIRFLLGRDTIQAARRLSAAEKKAMTDRKLSLVVFILLGGGLFSGVKTKVQAAENWGYLKVDARVEGKGSSNNTRTVKDDDFVPNTTNRFDQDIDIELDVGLIMPSESGAFVEIEGRKIWKEYSPNDPNYPKYLYAFFKGPIAQGEDPNVTLQFQLLYGGNFGGRRLITTEMYNDLNNKDPNNRQVELQQKIAESGDGIARIVYGKLPEGSYTPDSPFLCLRLDFDKLLTDFDSNDVVNFKDYATFANEFGETTQNIADISGPNDLPDLKVDLYDLSKFVEYWLEEI